MWYHPQGTRAGEGLRPGRRRATAPVDGAAGGDLALLCGTAKSNNSEANTGDWAVPNGGLAVEAARQSAQRWVQLTASRAGDLNPEVVNGAGLTLYRFDKDSTNPPASTCKRGMCADLATGHGLAGRQDLHRRGQQVGGRNS